MKQRQNRANEIIHCNIRYSLAEREGFEPPIGLHLCRISSAVHSTTLPPLRAPKRGDSAPVVGPSSMRGWRARQDAQTDFRWLAAMCKEQGRTREQRWSI